MVIFAFFILGSYAQDFEIDKKMIYWSSTPLTWDDFKKRPPRGSNYDAETMSTIDIQMAVSMDSVIVGVYTFFDPSSSWKRKKKLSKELLKHEQLHFDITEYHSRMMRKELLNTVFKKPQTVGKIIQKLFNQRIKKWKKMQDAYDNETKHSTVVEKQLAWEEDVKNLLAETEAYAEPIVRMAISN